MTGFKLIAIVPLKGCSSKFCKNLEIGYPYPFYKDYKIEVVDGLVSNVEPLKSKVPKDLFKLKNGIDLNISAVVGKNGSGKSSIFELLFYCVSVITTYKENLPNKLLKYSDTLIQKSKNLNEDYIILGRILGDPVNNKPENFNQAELNKIGFKSSLAYVISLVEKHDLKIKLRNTNSELDTAVKIWSEIGYQKALNEKLALDEKLKEEEIRSSLNVSLIYEINNSIFEIELIKGTFSQSIFKEKKSLWKNSLEEFDLTDFFYSIALNYSHHALNSRAIGNWVNQLFHKNDAYITPVVINPMRIDGNFDINHELNLSKERLMSNLIFNLLQDKDYRLLNKYKVSKFIFTPKVLVSYPINYGEEFQKDSTLNSLIIEEIGITKINEAIDYWDFAFAYLDNKLNRIGENYPFLVYSNDNKNDDPILNFIKTDKSHVSKKVRQTINFLKSTLTKENRSFWKTPESTVKIDLTTADFFNWLTTFKLDPSLGPSEIIEYALPGFFSIDFELECPNGDFVEFGKLSSGEQQMILNLNSILYHLYNLQSVHKSDLDRIKYANINIVLDEIELYYHPDMQRQLVSNIIENFENIKSDGEGIKSINLCFLTHSPFILSDIPSANILRLEGGKLDPNLPMEESFGGNIYSLLANDFFMKEGFMGAFVMRKIKEVLNYISVERYIEWKHNQCLEIAELIADSVVKNKLLQLLNSLKLSDKESELAILRLEQSEIEKKIKRLEEDDNA